MTVAELIEKLKELDPSLRVLIDGYEGGYEDADYVFVEKFAIGVRGDWDCEGPHELATNYWQTKEDFEYTTETCAVLPHRLYSFTGEM